jgi:hypothetical protein
VKGTRYDRSDVVLGMSLAEIMLLLVFAIVAGAVADEPPPQTTSCESELASCRQEVKRLTLEKSELEVDRDKWKNWYEMLVNMIGGWSGDSPPPPEEAGEGAKGYFARGAAECHRGANVAIEVGVLEGVQLVQLRQLPPDAIAFLAERDVALGSEDIRDSTAILRLISALRAFGESRNPVCRFDYVGRYKTNDDYFLIRDRYERFLYPAGLKRADAGNR